MQTKHRRKRPNLFITDERANTFSCRARILFRCRRASKRPHQSTTPDICWISTIPLVGATTPTNQMPVLLATTTNSFRPRRDIGRRLFLIIITAVVELHHCHRIFNSAAVSPYPPPPGQAASWIGEPVQCSQCQPYP